MTGYPSMSDDFLSEFDVRPRIFTALAVQVPLPQFPILRMLFQQHVKLMCEWMHF